MEDSIFDDAIDDLGPHFFYFLIFQYTPTGIRHGVPSIERRERVVPVRVPLHGYAHQSVCGQDQERNRRVRNPPVFPSEEDMERAAEKKQTEKEQMEKDKDPTKFAAKKSKAAAKTGNKPRSGVSCKRAEFRMKKSLLLRIPCIG